MRRLCAHLGVVEAKGKINYIGELLGNGLLALEVLVGVVTAKERLDELRVDFPCQIRSDLKKGRMKETIGAPISVPNS